MIPGSGWRVFVVLRENEDKLALPIIAWREDMTGTPSTEKNTLTCYVETEPGIVSRLDQIPETSLLVVRFLAPGDDIDEADFEQAQQLVEIHWRGDD